MNKWNGNVEAFRTYFHGKIDKNGSSIPKEKVKGMPGHSWNDVCNDQDFGAVLNEGFIDISFDSKEASDSFWNMAADNDWNCLILENPDNKHIHSIWKKPYNWKYADGKDKKTAVGLIADVHSGSTYIRLRVNGVDRFPPLFEPDNIQEVPEELFLISSNTEPFGMSEGGRNEALSCMAKNMIYNTRFSKEQIKNILTNTNLYEIIENSRLYDLSKPK